jgi:hypothetical protein
LFVPKKPAKWYFSIQEGRGGERGEGVKLRKDPIFFGGKLSYILF